MTVAYSAHQGGNFKLKSIHYAVVAGKTEHEGNRKVRFVSLIGIIGKYITKETLINALFCCSPLLVFLLVIYLLKANPFHWVPLWNDEAGWYIQINSVVKYGIPLGFTGYNETHATIGTFGPWGAFIVCLMSLFGKIFGWHYYSPLFMNVVYLILANFVFLLFTRPKILTVVKLTVLNFVLFLSIQYMFTGMSECTRFSMSIVLAGMFCFLLNNENRGTRSFLIILSVIAPVLLFLFINSYILFSFLLPVYGYVWFKYLNLRRYRSLLFVVLSVFLPLIFALACFFIQMKTTAPYPINALRKYLDQPNLAMFFGVLKDTIVGNIKNADLAFIFRNSKISNGCISSYLLFYYFLLAVTAIKLVVSVKSNGRVHPFNFLVTYALFIFMVAFWVFYSTKSPWTYIRGLNVALVFSLYLVCMLDWSRLHMALFCFIFVQFLPFTSIIKDDMAIRYSYRNAYGGGYKLLEEYSTIYSNNLSISKSEDPWDNTVACYGKSYNIGCAFPAGLSWNYIMDGHAAHKARYIATDRMRNWTFNGYKKIYSDDLTCIFEKIKEGKE